MLVYDGRLRAVVQAVRAYASRAGGSNLDLARPDECFESGCIRVQVV